MPRHPRQTFSDSLSVLQQNYLRRVAGYIADVGRLSALIEKGYLPVPELQKIFQITHNLMGSGATFGFPQISSTATALHIAVSEYLEGGGASRQQGDLIRKFEPFVQACADAVNRQVTGRKLKQKKPSLSLIRPLENEKTIYLAGNSADEVQALATALADRGLTARHVDSVGELNQLLEGTVPQAVVLFTGDIQGEVQELRLPDRNGRNIGPLFAVVSSQTDFRSRLAALRAGATIFLPNGIDPGRLTDLITEPRLHAENVGRSKHVLILDADETSSAFYAHSLRQGGHQATLTESPTEVLDLISSTAADALLTAIQLEGCSGQELATIVRQTLQRPTFPVLFTVDRTGYEGLQPDFRDDTENIFLVKPFSPTQLISLVSQLRLHAAD